ncbi:MAG: DinB family protein [Ktedonobacteraceae bacterium]|nr:DinB family protein [Chloroflexota bacterium]
MTEQALPLTTFYAGWDGFRQELVKIITPLSPAQLALPTAPHHWSIGRLLTHMVADRAWWFHLWMGEGKPDLASIAHWDDDGQPMRTSAELVAGLETTGQMIAGALARWTPADLGQSFPAPASLSEKEQQAWGERTRQWMIWHVLEHEIYHGGELSLALGSYGLEGVYGNA